MTTLPTVPKFPRPPHGRLVRAVWGSSYLRQAVAAESHARTVASDLERCGYVVRGECAEPARRPQVHAGTRR